MRIVLEQPAGAIGADSMKFGFTVMADIDEIGFFSHAETLGYDEAKIARLRESKVI